MGSQSVKARMNSGGASVRAFAYKVSGMCLKTHYQPNIVTQHVIYAVYQSYITC